MEQIELIVECNSINKINAKVVDNFPENCRLYTSSSRCGTSLFPHDRLVLHIYRADKFITIVGI